MSRPIRLRLSELRLGEDFTTATLGLRGRVLDWGHVRPSGWLQEMGLPRPRWAAVLVEIAGQQCAMSPELVVYVDGDRPHWRACDVPEDRWVPFLRTEGEEGEAA